MLYKCIPLYIDAFTFQQRNRAFSNKQFEEDQQHKLKTKDKGDKNNVFGNFNVIMGLNKEPSIQVMRFKNKTETDEKLKHAQ